MIIPTYKIAVLSIGYPNFRYDIAKKNMKHSIKVLDSLEGVVVVSLPEVQIVEEELHQAMDHLLEHHPDMLLLQLGTYSYGSALMACLDKLKGIDLMLWGFREPILDDYPGLPLNSLCALNMYTSFLHHIGKRDFTYLYGNPEEPDVVEKLNRKIWAARIKKGLKKSKFCIIGGRVPGFYLSNVDELKFRHEIGPEISYYSIAALLHDVEHLPEAEVKEEMRRLKEIVSNCDCKEEALEKSARIALAVRRYASLNHITGFAFKCWPDLQDLYHIAPCAAIAALNQEGILVSCEGDVTGLATMYMQQCLSNLPVFLTDLVNITKEGIIKLWHCGAAPPSIAADNQDTYFGEHPTIKQGIGIGGTFDLAKGRILIAKLSEDKSYKMLLAEGRCIAPDRKLTGNQGDILLNGCPEKLLDLIVSEGIEHHYVMAYDVDIGVMEELCSLLGIRAVVLKGGD